MNYNAIVHQKPCAGETAQTGAGRAGAGEGAGAGAGLKEVMRYVYMSQDM